MLADEYGTASNIKSRVNRQSVLGAITSCQQRLKLYNRVPNNGLVLFTGTVVTDDGKERKLNIDFEPFKPINTSLYLCDNRFHTESLAELLESDSRYGFIVMDGNGSLFGTLSGNTRDVLHKFSVELPKKHGRGGQSALRFARLRLEKRHNYVRKVAETATQVFVPSGERPNIAGLVLAGSAEFKNELADSDLFDARLKNIVVAVVDVSYGEKERNERGGGGVSAFRSPAWPSPTRGQGTSPACPHPPPLIAPHHPFLRAHGCLTNFLPAGVGAQALACAPPPLSVAEDQMAVTPHQTTPTPPTAIRTGAAGGSRSGRGGRGTASHVWPLIALFSRRAKQIPLIIIVLLNPTSHPPSPHPPQAARTGSTRPSSCPRTPWPTSSSSRRSGSSPASSTKSPRTRAKSYSGWPTPWPAWRWGPWKP